ncbi:hypothetical protein LOTGIDRAFT_106465, partial [Lottia gigantea]
VELVNGTKPNEGRVEIIRNGIRGTVCDDDWNNEDASVICNRLGFPGAISSPGKAFYGVSNEDNDILMDNVQCKGTETTLQSCVHDTSHDCAASEAASVVCKPNQGIFGSMILQLYYRLRGNSLASNAGRIEVFRDGRWGLVCDDEWDIQDASVACKQLGFKHAAKRDTSDVDYGSGSGNILLSDVECFGNETSLNECEKSPWRQHSCQSFEAVGVDCRVEKETIVELVNGTKPNEGRVEIIRNGIRGTVCDDDWNNEDASVICNRLGFPRGGKAVNKAHFGEGSGIIWLDNVACSGVEDSIDDCRPYWGIHDCDHNEDAGVICLEGSLPGIHVQNCQLFWIAQRLF